MSDERSEAEEGTSEEEEQSSDEAQSQEEAGESSESGEGQGANGDIDEEQDPKAVVNKLEEEGPPERLEDWPQGKAKYETFGGPEGEHGYHEGPEQQLGPSSLRHHEEGDVSIGGEQVDNPEEYKGEPIPGGPTDPDSPDAKGEASEDSGEGEGESGEGSGDQEDEE